MASQSKPFGGISLGGHTVSGPGQSTTQQNIQIVVAPDALKGTTRFQDLGPQYQNEIMQIDKEIQEQIKLAVETREKLPAHGAKVASVAPDVAFIESFLSTVELGIDNDSNNIAQLREVCKRDNDDALLCFRAIENLKLPSQFHYANMSTLPGKSRVPTAQDTGSDDPTRPVDLVAYFSKRADDLGLTLDSYQRQIREIEAHLRTMEEGTQVMAQELMGSRDKLRDQRRELVEALKAIESAILNAAKKVGETREQVVKQTVGGVGRGLGLGV
jgi:nucleoporin p58/p45